MDQKQSLENWLVEVMSDEIKGKCTALSCVHKVGSSDDEVYGIQLGETQWEVKKLASVLVHKAKTRVQEEPGSHLFHVLAFYGEELPGAKFPFRVNSIAELGGGATEEPSERGERAQKMRHGEAAFQFAFKHSIALFDTMHELNRDLMQHVRLLSSENADAIKVCKEVMLSQVTNQHELRMKEMAFLRNARREDQFTKMLPALANTITGKEVFPVEKQDTAIIEMLLAGMDEQKLRMFISMLPSEEARAIVSSRAAEFFKAKHEAEQMASNVANVQAELDEPKAAE